MSELINDFNQYREKMNAVILGKNNLVMKRLWNLDTNTYEDGALSRNTKEMLGLVASMVLRCDDCIKYHLGKCFELGNYNRRSIRYFFCCKYCGWNHRYSTYPQGSGILGSFTGWLTVTDRRSVINFLILKESCKIDNILSF